MNRQLSHRRTLPTLLVALAVLVAAPVATLAQESMMAEPAIETVEVASPGSPLVAVRMMFRVGSIDDPKGKEGLASLTGLMVAQASTEKHTYGELLDALYPMAASIGVNTDREVTVIAGETHIENLEAYTELLTEAVLHPAFTQSDFERNKDQLLSYLTTTLRGANDELLGLEALQQEIWQNHPYGHAPAGTVQGLESITLEDVEAFYEAHFTRANLLLGLAGGYPGEYPEALRTTLAALPAGSAEMRELPPLPVTEGRNYTLIDKETASVGIHFGYAIPVTRADDDYYPLMVANSHLGEHRTFNGVLMNQLRGKRGLNYGDYSYIEYYAAPPFTSRPTPNVPRHQQYFSVWIRPVVPTDDRFALRAGLYFVQDMVDNGLTPEQFELARDFMLNYSKLWAQSLSERLGVQMDSRYYGMPYWIDEIDRRLKELTVEEVNAAVKKYIRTDAYEAVMVTKGAKETAIALLQDRPSPKQYNSEVEDQVTEDDKSIVKLPVDPTSIEIVPVAQVFEKR